MSKAHISPAIAIRGMLKQFCISKFLIFANWRQKKEAKGTSIFWQLVFGVHNRSTLCPCVYQFKLSMPHRKVWQKINFWNLRERKLKNKGINKHKQPDSSIHDTSTYCPCVEQVSTLYAPHSLRKERWFFFYIWKLERNKNKETKGRISRRSLVFFQIKQQMIDNICTKLQNPTCNSSWEIFVTNFPMYWIGVRDGRKEKEGKINISRFVSCPTIYLATFMEYTKFEETVSHRNWEICNRKFDWRERKMDK